MSGSLTISRIRDTAVISLVIGAHLGPLVGVGSWMLFFASPVTTTLRELVPLMAFRLLLGFVLGLIGAISLGMQSLMYAALSILLKRPPSATLPENLLAQCALFAAIGGAMGGVAAGAI